jgi:hypothetical protein
MRQTHTASIFSVVLLLLVLLTGCGTLGQTAGSTPTSSMSDTPTAISSTPTSDPSVRLTPNKNGISIDLSGLHIDASDGVQCPLGAVTNGPPDNPGPLVSGQRGNNLVLATDRLTYDANELQQMSDYVNSVGNPTTPVPDTLQWVLGGPTDTSHVASGGGYIYNCGIRLGLTNTSQNSIQISNAGVQLAGDTQQNNYHYRLIDICTIITSCKSGGGPGDCSQYFATIKLGTGPINAVFSAIPEGRDSSCGELTLNPGDEKTLYVYIYSAQNLIYSVVPQLVLTTVSGPNTLTLTDLTSTLAFANGSQFTCYALHGDTFVAETTPPTYFYCL